MRSVALGARFLLELCILGSFAAWAARLRFPVAERILICAALCVAAAVAWGMLLSPKRRFDLAAPIRLALEAAFFLAAAAALFDLGYRGLGIALLIVALAQRIALSMNAPDR